MAHASSTLCSAVRAYAVPARRCGSDALSSLCREWTPLQQTSGSRARRTASSDGGLPPLIDRELFFGNPEIATGTISPDGRYIASASPGTGR
jgi:hypothetical protein